jgi:hypothetical protein
MARGDFRSSIGQLISGTQRQIHNTSQTVPAYRPVKQKRNALVEGAINGLGYVTKALDERKRRQEYEAERQKRKAEAEAEREQREQEATTQRLERHLYNKRYKATQQQQSEFIAQIAQTNPNDVFLSDEEFIEKYGDQLQSVNLEDINDPELLELAEINESEDLSILLGAARNGVEQAQELRRFVSLTDLSAGENFEDIDEIYQAGKDRMIPESQIYAAFMSSAYSAAAQGNYDSAERVAQFAVENLKDPELRDKVISEMQPLVARGRQNRVEYTMEARRAMAGARSIAEVNEIVSEFPEGTFSDSVVFNAWDKAEKRQYKQNFIEAATTDFRNGNVTIDVLYGRLQGVQTITGEMTNNEHTIELNRDEVDREVNLAFLDLMERNPNAVPEVLRRSRKAPPVFNQGIADFFQSGLTAQSVEDIDFQSNNYEFVLQAIEAVDGKNNPFGSAAVFATKFGLQGEQKAVATLMFNRMAVMKSTGEMNVQAALESAFDTVRRNREFGSMFPEQSYTSELNSLLDEEAYPPEIRHLARTFIQDYKGYIAPREAAQASIENAMAMSTEVDGIIMVNGNDFLGVANQMLGEYSGTTTEDLIDDISDELDFSVEYSTFNPVGGQGGRLNPHFSTLVLANEEGERMAYTLQEIQDFIREKYADRHYSELLRQNDRAREGQRGSIPESALPLHVSPQVFYNQTN